MMINSMKDDIEFAGISLSTHEIIEAANSTNLYLRELYVLFTDIDINLFTILDQRNISGVIGEIFSRFLARGNALLKNNPHPDGRPDILVLNDAKATEYLTSCFDVIKGKRIPSKKKLTPFKFGGLEVKCTIGEPISNYEEKLMAATGNKEFHIGVPRVLYLSNLNWWAHHTESTNMLGLYYDYHKEADGVPQIVAGFFGILTSENWNKVSVGKTEHKKTSNTSLNSSGKEIMKGNCIFVTDDMVYQRALLGIGVQNLPFDFPPIPKPKP